MSRMVERKREYGKEYYRKNADKWKTYYKRMREDTPWLWHYKTAKRRCEYSRLDSYPWYGGRGIQFLLTKQDVEELWKRDNAQDMAKPTIDRIDSNSNYTFDNCRFIEHSKNSENKRTVDGKAWETINGVRTWRDKTPEEIAKEQDYLQNCGSCLPGRTKHYFGRNNKRGDFAPVTHQCVFCGKHSERKMKTFLQGGYQ